MDEEDGQAASGGGQAGGADGEAEGLGAVPLGHGHVARDASPEEELLPLPLWERAEWADLQPLHLVDSSGVVAIDYDAHHRQALGYFRRILERGELSQRALELTAKMISLNQADYTAWEWRWRCLRALNVDLRVEYLFTDGIMRDNAKNYQLWNHRRKCALALGENAARRELEVAAEALALDAKNYHAWAHRQAIVTEFGGLLWDEEVDFLDRCIAEDLRNNSAWSQRAFVLTHQLQQLHASGALPASGAPAGVPTSVAAALGVEMSVALRTLLQREIAYASSQVARAPRNESSWNYLRGLFRLPGVPRYAMATFDEVASLCRDTLLDAPSSPCALDLFATYYEQLAHLALKQLSTLPPPPPTPDTPMPPAGEAQDAGAVNELATAPAAGAAMPAPAVEPQVALAGQLGPEPQQGDHMVEVGQDGAGFGPGLGPGEVVPDGVAGQAEGQVAPKQGLLHPAVAARVALERAAGSTMVLLESLTIADPVRVMYWRHRQQGVQELLQLAAVLHQGGEDVGAAPAGG